jgi:uncharacterized protein
VERISETPQTECFEAKPAWWDEQRVDGESDYSLSGPLRFEFEAYRVRTQIHLEGELSGSLEVECSRCVSRYRHALRDSFRLVLDEARDRVPADPEGARALQRDGMCLGEEVEAGLYRGPEIQLDAFFGELVSLAIPVQPLCRESCLGLCPSCGTNLNEGACGCDESRPESPFAVLASLKTN